MKRKKKQKQKKMTGIKYFQNKEDMWYLPNGELSKSLKKKDSPNDQFLNSERNTQKQPELVEEAFPRGQRDKKSQITNSVTNKRSIDDPDRDFGMFYQKKQRKNRLYYF